MFDSILDLNTKGKFSRSARRLGVRWANLHLLRFHGPNVPMGLDVGRRSNFRLLLHLFHCILSPQKSRARIWLCHCFNRSETCNVRYWLSWLQISISPEPESSFCFSGLLTTKRDICRTMFDFTSSKLDTKNHLTSNLSLQFIHVSMHKFAAPINRTVYSIGIGLASFWQKKTSFIYSRLPFSDKEKYLTLPGTFLDSWCLVMFTSPRTGVGRYHLSRLQRFV